MLMHSSLAMLEFYSGPKLGKLTWVFLHSSTSESLAKLIFLLSICMCAMFKHSWGIFLLTKLFRGENVFESDVYICV